MFITWSRGVSYVGECARTSLTLHFTLRLLGRGTMHANVGLEVTAGSSFCQIDANGCATDGVGAHGNNEACTIRVGAAGTLTATQFDTETGYDYVTIGGIRYEGSTGPTGVAVAAGSTFTWRSDGSVTNAGWTICFGTTWARAIQFPSTYPGRCHICLCLSWPTLRGNPVEPCPTCSPLLHALPKSLNHAPAPPDQDRPLTPWSEMGWKCSAVFWPSNVFFHF